MMEHTDMTNTSTTSTVTPEATPAMKGTVLVMAASATVPEFPCTVNITAPLGVLLMEKDGDTC